MKFLFPCVALLVSTASAQFTLPANPITNNQGAINWGIFFDLTAGPNDLLVTGLTTASIALPLDPVDLNVFTRLGTALTGVGGNVATGPGSTMGAPYFWSLLGTASGTQSATGPISDPISIPDILVPAGTTVGVCLQFTSTGPAYFGTGSTDPYQTFSDGNLTLTCGDSRSAIFTTGGFFFAPRCLTGEIFYSEVAPGIGENFCGPAVPNTTGLPSEILATGSFMANDVMLRATQLPPFTFGFFITSMTESFVMNPNGSQGNLCLGGDIGRFVGPGEIQSSGANGTISIDVDLNELPQPTGTVVVTAGETWSFQLWHRDIVSGIGTSNFTDGLRITFN